MNWKEILQDNVTEAAELSEIFDFTEEEIRNIEDELEQFPMSVTKYYLSLIDKGDPEDPIRKMAVPPGCPVEYDGELDTSGEQSNTKLAGVQHKYRETVLVLVTDWCAMYCRHCFRRRLVGTGGSEASADPGRTADYIRQHPEVTNVLLSGGDSFLLDTAKIREWLETLTALEQLDFIRFGTRTPVTFPQRILEDPELLTVLSEYSAKKQLYVVTHYNHPREMTPESAAAVRLLQKAGVVVKNQTVLLRGVNDTPEVLAALLRKVTSLGIVQHYIFQCRPVAGVKSRFQVPLAGGLEIVRQALAMQNGLGKSADYTMSHVTGKIRILSASEEGKLLMQYRQAKNPEMIGKVFLWPDGSDAWLPDQFTPEEAGF